MSLLDLGDMSYMGLTKDLWRHILKDYVLHPISGGLHPHMNERQSEVSAHNYQRGYQAKKLRGVCKDFDILIKAMSYRKRIPVAHYRFFYHFAFI